MASLDPNHTHFLLVDDGREKVFGAEIPLRSELEHYISAVGTTGVAQGQSEFKTTIVVKHKHHEFIKLISFPSSSLGASILPLPFLYN